MSPFNTQESPSPKRNHIFAILFLIIVLGFIYWLIPSDVQSSYKQYQKALIEYDMQQVLELSDQKTHQFAENLLGWVLRGEDADIRRMTVLEQNLVWSARCQAIMSGTPITDEVDLLTAWISRLKVAFYLPQTSLRNSYANQGEAQAQVFDNQTRILTDLKIHFYEEGDWKVDTIGLLQDLINQVEGDPLLVINQDFFSAGFIDEYTLPLKDWGGVFPEPKEQED